LLPSKNPLWDFAREATARAAAIAEAANRTHGKGFCKSFRPNDRVKAEVHTWLAWCDRPGSALGAAINDGTLRCDSEHAIDFLKWIKRVYSFDSLAV
ncbi:MAG TPA: DUF3226 domain-containing protein, partial [Pirellulales bacterium]